MDNYKIKVKDEAESKEAQELFFELGYEWRDSKRDITNLDVVFIYAKDGVLTAGFNDHNFAEAGHKELTLPQLRDLVVLKRNDVKDATHRDKLDESIYLTSDKVIYYWYGEWCKSAINKSNAYEDYIANSLTPITQPQDPALISGDVALANVHKCIVQYLHDDEPYGRWTTITDHFWSQYHLGMFLDPDTKFKFRFKPQTIKLELELPKPFEPEEDCHVYILDDGKTDGYRRYSYEVHGDKGNTFIGIWRTEDEIKQVVEQLRKIRGTNS
ncbi:hypothetical protein KTH23_08260 [Acinetobacter baumannii]|uniref:hypothetical protein n=1 Tax=Acinetobacter baumannii TaxID=470 RepID=UPI0003F5D912|nr:hypothetical protein [Acinetobacter baumannii]MCT9171053.1 hypothetical protein [Acinetobacter baumannii]MCT9202543.1 hypothetical protein [Acinetobacter baumannii]MCT9231088.1 hypothetical protein [Acinetobacter baumannii]PPC47399.1 hypothetical protein AbaMCR6739_05755 [Acinetobacter baumannii]RSR18883.1 hypothetical protein EA682_12550 [Acinetobacter baumannii]